MFTVSFVEGTYKYISSEATDVRIGSAFMHATYIKH